MSDAMNDFLGAFQDLWQARGAFQSLGSGETPPVIFVPPSRSDVVWSSQDPERREMKPRAIKKLYFLILYLKALVPS